MPRPDENCISCGKCTEQCDFDALVDKKEKGLRLDPEKCIGCGVCTLACPNQALKLYASNRKPEIFRDARALYERVEQDNKQGR